jgi:hypothetical protein
VKYNYWKGLRESGGLGGTQGLCSYPVQRKPMQTSRVERGMGEHGLGKADLGNKVLLEVPVARFPNLNYSK